MQPEDTPDQNLPSERPDGRSSDAPSVKRAVGRHRAEDRRPPSRPRFSSTPVRVALATGVTCCLGLVAFAETRAAGGRPEPVREALAERAVAGTEGRASRSLDRAASPSPTPSPTASAKPPAGRQPARPERPARPRPVAGLNQLQMDNAKIIVDTGVGLKLPRRALVVAVATAMQESNLHNLASDVLPESSRYPHQGSGADHDSVGLFQQRPSSGWGTVAQLMRPAYAARAFYLALREVPGWQELSIAAAAQAVQVSAYPDAYARHERRATAVVDALT